MLESAGDQPPAELGLSPLDEPLAQQEACFMHIADMPQNCAVLWPNPG